eukprot:scaffold10799_cov48-Phaeocystis_antarctica.AAC.3
MKEVAPLSASKRPRSGRPFAAAEGSVAHAGCGHVGGRLLLRSSAASTSLLGWCWPAISNRGPPQREAVKLASAAASGREASCRRVLLRACRPGGATASIVSRVCARAPSQACAPPRAARPRIPLEPKG